MNDLSFAYIYAGMFCRQQVAINHATDGWRGYFVTEYVVYWDMDVSMIAQLELYKPMLEDYSPEDQGRECNLFHKLVDHVGIPYKHLCRIGRISTDIRVWHQNEWDVTKPAFPQNIL